MMGRGFDNGYGYWCDMMGGHGLFFGVLALLFGALVIGGAVLLVVWAVRTSSRPGAQSAPAPPVDAPGAQDEALAIARRRLANGEITPEQYEEIVRVLRT